VLSAPVVVDTGSGLLSEHPRLPAEPSARNTLRAGADLVTASGDKLLGGPQCGLLLGTAEIIGKLRRHPLARALRVDKLTLAALEATLAGPATPVARALDADPAHLQLRAERIADELAGIVKAEVLQSNAAVGGGGAPGVDLPSVAVAVPRRLAAPLRLGTPPVMARLEGGRLLLDLVAVPVEQDAVLTQAVRLAVAAADDDDEHPPGRDD
jgi:L-seryl-tRNA(Ser) seleniumtransferase